MTSGGLYDDGLERWMSTDVRENARVRDLFILEKIRWMTENTDDPKTHPVGHGGGGDTHRDSCKVCRAWRVALAEEWVAVAEKNQGSSDVELLVPGCVGKHQKQQTQYVDEHARRVDAAYTRVRELEAAKLCSDWVLVGIETTIADRRGLSYPAGAYNSQHRLFA